MTAVAKDPGETLIKLSSRDVADARRLLTLITEAGITDSPTNSIDRDGWTRLRDRARQILDGRARRLRFFSPGMFGEPAWDMLLVLFVMEQDRRLTITQLAEAASVSRSTAMRWLDYLETQKLVTREPHPTDKRAAYVALTERAKNVVGSFLSDTVNNKGQV